MRDTAAVKIDGLPRLRRALREVGRDVADLKAANAKAAALVAAASSPRAPRRSGALAASVRGNRAAGRASIAAGGAALPYAGPIHWGWPARNIAPNPFIVEAAQATESLWLAAYAEDLDRLAASIDGTY